MFRKPTFATADDIKGFLAKKQREQKQELAPSETSEAMTVLEAPEPEIPPAAPTDSKIGIEQSEKLFSLFAAIVSLLGDVMQGRKITALNALMQTVKTFVKNRSVFQEMPVVWDELRDLDANEYEQLCQLLAAQFDVNPDQMTDEERQRLAGAVRGILDITAFAVQLKKPL